MLSVFEGILDRLEAALLPRARGRSTRGVVRGHRPGDEAPPDLDRYRYRYVSKKDLLCRKRRENIFFCGILDCLEAPLLPWARVRSTPGVVRGLVPGGRGSPHFGPVPVPVRVKKISFVSKKGAKISFVSKKSVKTSNPCFDVEFRADHFIVWGPHAYFDGFR